MEIKKLGGGTFTEAEARNLQVGQSIYLPVSYQSGPGTSVTPPLKNTPVLIRTGVYSPGDPQNCSNILQEIKRRLFSHKPPDNLKGVLQRWNELRDDVHHLQWDNWTTRHPDGYGSVVSHQDEFRTGQRRLRDYLEDWTKNNCDDPKGPSQLPVNVWDWATRPAPEPTPQPRPVKDTPHSVSVQDVLNAVAIVGLSILLVPEIIAAIIDPEPTTKLATIGLTAATINQLKLLLHF